MLLIIFLVLALLLVQSFLPAQYLTKQVGTETQMGGRDDLPPPTTELKRARNALRNFQETLPIFLTLAVLSIVFGQEGWLTTLGAIVYLVMRIVYVVCYMRALSPWRSICYLGAMVGMLLMALPLIPYIWS